MNLILKNLQGKTFQLLSKTTKQEFGSGVEHLHLQLMRFCPAATSAQACSTGVQDLDSSLTVGLIFHLELDLNVNAVLR